MARINKDHIEKWFDYGLSVETRTVTLWGDVDAQSVELTIGGLHVLAAMNAEPITLLINSPGGCWYNGMALHNFIAALPNHVTAKVCGQAMSMASVILQACDTRLAYPDATIMVHDGQDWFDGHPRTFENWASYSKTLRKRMYDIYAARSGKSASYWHKHCEQDYILTAQEALEEGLIDSIIEVIA